MNFKNLELRISYHSKGEDAMAKEFIIPALSCARKYKRSVGFFSSSVIETIMDAIPTFVRRGGHIYLIASPQLSLKDVEAINLGYKRREEVIKDCFTNDFSDEIAKLNDAALEMLAELISRCVLDIKICDLVDDDGIYHDKLGVLIDDDGNRIVFSGSSNSSGYGYLKNYEKIRVAKSWGCDYENQLVNDDEEEFDSIWNGTNPFLKTYEYTEVAKQHVLQIVEHRKNKKTENSNGIKLRKYQEEARDAWIANSYHGFFVMATGTGKTWTAIFSAKALVEKHTAIIVICAPYKHLVKQWSEDVENAFPGGQIIMVFSENPQWEAEISNAIVRRKYDKKQQLIIISTIASFQMDRFKNTISKSDEDKLLIVDEAHRFSNRPEWIKEEFVYMLGLSATPYSGTSAQSGNELMNYFGGRVYNLPIEEALEKKFLVPYNYFPIYVYATPDEENSFSRYTSIMAGCWRNGVCIDPDEFIKAKRARLRVISMADEKQKNLDYILGHVTEKNHFVVYCGDGRLFSLGNSEGVRHISAVKAVLTEHGFKSSQFTASENMMTRMKLVDSFNKGEIDALAAIRCLDEGINIPSIKSALILSSNDDYREFVQRRGRILRKYDDKEFANIYDVIVLPSSENDSWARIELRRFREYAKLALNSDEQMEELNRRLSDYGLTEEDIDVYDYEEMEEPLDE